MKKYRSNYLKALLFGALLILTAVGGITFNRTVLAADPWLAFTSLEYSGGSATFAWAEYESPSTPTFTCKIDTKPAVACTSPRTYSITNGDLLAGAHTFTVTSSNGPSLTKDFYVSSIVRSIVFTTKPANSISNTTQANFEWTLSGFKKNAKSKCYLDEVLQASCTSPKNLGTLAPGTHEFKVVVREGNKVATAGRAFTVTSPAPDPNFGVQIISSPPTQTTNTSANFVWTTAGTITGTTCTLDSVPTSCSGTSISYAGPLSSGNHTFEVSVTNGTNTASDSRTWTITDPAPVVTLTNKPDATTSSATATFEWAVALPTNHNYTSSCSLDGATGTTCTSPKTYSSLSAGKHTFVVTVTDTTSNLTGTATFTWSITNCINGCTFGKGTLQTPDASDGAAYVTFGLRSGPSTIPAQPTTSYLLYRWNTTTDVIDIVSTDHGTTTVGPNNIGTNNNNPSISGDGNLVTFISASSSLYSTSQLPAGVSTKPTFVAGRYNVYLKNMTNGALTLISVGTNGNHGVLSSNHPYISRNGNYIAFSSGFNLTSGESDITSNQQDLYRYDIAGGSLVQAINLYRGVSSTNDRVNISDDGSRLAFITNELPGDAITGGTGTTVPVNHNGVSWAGSVECDTPEGMPEGETYNNTCGTLINDIRKTIDGTTATSNFVGISGDGEHFMTASTSCGNLYIDGRQIPSENLSTTSCNLNNPFSIGVAQDGQTPVAVFTQNDSGLAPNDTSGIKTPVNGTTYHYPESDTAWYEMYEYNPVSSIFARDSLTLANGCDWGAVPSTTASCSGQTVGAGYQLNGKADQGTLSRDGTVAIYRNWSTNVDTVLNANDSPTLTADIVAGPSKVFSIGSP